MSTRRLLIDAGNTRLKWAVVENGAWTARGNADYGDLSALSRVLTAPAECYIASVTRAQHEDQLGAVLASSAIVPMWLKAESRMLGVSNGYSNPRHLGVDRWMSLIAARQRTQAPALVVSAGTAMTVDALSTAGAFMGGLIAPGFAMMQQALQQGTARISSVAGTWRAFPRSTEDAALSGIIAALCGAIHMQHARLAALAGCMPVCFLTGGDAEKLLPHLEVPAEYVPALVLEGIDCVARRGEAE
jgi:type III pantothenate kinase